MGSKGAKIHAPEPPSNRLATLLRPALMSAHASELAVVREGPDRRDTEPSDENRGDPRTAPASLHSLINRCRRHEKECRQQQQRRSVEPQLDEAGTPVADDCSGDLIDAERQPDGKESEREPSHFRSPRGEPRTRHYRPRAATARPGMEAMGSKGAKIRAAQPPSDRLASYVRPTPTATPTAYSLGCLKRRSSLWSLPS
jgi:hypothetical protein